MVATANSRSITYTNHQVAALQLNTEPRQSNDTNRFFNLITISTQSVLNELDRYKSERSLHHGEIYPTA
jgi:hypothetical protein